MVTFSAAQTFVRPVLVRQAEPSAQHPSVKAEVHDAHRRSNHREDGGRNIWIDGRVQIVQKKAALVWAHAGLNFKPVFQHGKRTCQGESSTSTPQSRQIMWNQRSLGREWARSAPKITHMINSRCSIRTRDANAEYKPLITGNYCRKAEAPAARSRSTFMNPAADP